MKLRNQGPIQAAPRLEDHAGMLASTVESWPGVAAFTHWQPGSPGVVDGAEFHVGDDELGHVHLDATAHILMGRTITSLLSRKSLGKPPSWSDAWITHPVRSPADVRHGVWLFQLAYDRLRGASEDGLLMRIAQGTGPS
ncbi:MAG: DUF5519 family protein [Gluconacetobacter diazotrophicus]|nr:DUF5519 family protein [Gluconacetobacter diazotrophicus]